MTDGKILETSMDRNAELIRKLKEIGTDLWGGLAENHEAPAEQKERVAETGLLLPVDSLFRVADETVEWTEALAYERSPDGLTSRKQWDYYRKEAEAVLRGDLRAYVRVLTALNPLGDLAAYTKDMKIRTPDAERLEAVFECREDLMAEDSALYLSALPLRIARDLFAVLPITEVGIEARADGKTCLKLELTREQLERIQFMYLDPIRFVRNCQGKE